MTKNEIFCACTVDMKLVQEAIRKLSERETKVLDLFYGITDGRKPRANELAVKYNCSIADLYAIKDAALNKLRHEMKARNNHKDRFKCENCVRSEWLLHKNRGMTSLMEALLTS